MNNEHEYDYDMNYDMNMNIVKEFSVDGFSKVLWY